jgi:hypothetical protein
VGKNRLFTRLHYARCRDWEKMGQEKVQVVEPFILLQCPQSPDTFSLFLLVNQTPDKKLLIDYNINELKELHVVTSVNISYCSSEKCRTKV